MTQFSINTHRIDPYKNFKFRVRIGKEVVAGVSKVSGLKRTTEVVPHRDGGQPSTVTQSPGQSKFEPITLERGITHDRQFEEWAHQVYSPEGDGGISLLNFRKDIIIELCNLNGIPVLSWQVFRCWPSEYTPLPELDANGNAVAFETVVLQNEGFQRDEAVKERKET
jgi:phage tail-like protein